MPCFVLRILSLSYTFRVSKCTLAGNRQTRRESNERSVTYNRFRLALTMNGV